jgi:hypothetical protein
MTINGFVKHLSGQMLSSKQYQNLKSIIIGLQAKVLKLHKIPIRFVADINYIFTLPHMKANVPSHTDRNRKAYFKPYLQNCCICIRPACFFMLKFVDI